MSRLRNISLIAMTVLLASVAPAVAASPVNDAYGSSDTASLPFSGLDLGLIAFGGLVLLALGVGLRRATRAQ